MLQNPDDVGGFLRVWPRQLPREDRHIGYAIQWFAFASIALVLWLRFSLVRFGWNEHGVSSEFGAIGICCTFE